MVVCGVVVEEACEGLLHWIGVKDSKQLSPKRRLELCSQIKRLAKQVVVLQVPAKLIDAYRLKGIKLDELEAKYVARIINAVNAQRIYVDAPGSNPKRFESMLKKEVDKDVELVVENYADQRYVVVAAASIVGKVVRDRCLKRIERLVGCELGVGYSHDLRCISFVEGLLKQGKPLPDCVRKTWSTIKELRAKLCKRSLKEFAHAS